MTEMVQAQPETSERVTDFRFEQLAAAFDRVINGRDWQAPIRARIPVADRQIVETAVIWFTETVPSFETLPDDAGYLMVSAIGFRRGAEVASTGR
jgi:hypothetical protein